MDDRNAGGEAAPALLLDQVVKTYGPVRAIDGVSLAAQPGEFIALLGPNGEPARPRCLQLLSGLFVPDAGRIVVMGHDMSRDPVPALAQLGIVFQQPTLDLGLKTITANLLFHAGLHGIPRAVAKERIARELARLGLADRAHDEHRRFLRWQPPPRRARACVAARAAAAADGRGDGGIGSG